MFEISPGRTVTADGAVQVHKTVRRVPVDAVKDVEIWSMDRLEI